MPKPDAAHLQTDKELAKLEKRIAKIYKEAADDLQSTIDDYFAKFAKRDAKQKARLESGEITEQEYKQWRLAQMGRGERFKALQSRVAERYTEANETAVRYVNDATPGIYSLNRNYSAYTIEKVAGNVGFDLWDEQTVRRLIVDNPEVMPYYPPEKALKRGIDLAYGKKQISASVTSSILQGKSIPRIAKDLQTRIPDMNKSSAIRTARTAVTGAQNAGRMDSYVAAEKMGIKVRKEWLATIDGRTRHSHAMLDGQTADIDKPFKVDGKEIMFPGDTSVPGYLVYNCRCSLVADVDGVDTSNAKRRVRNPETGKNELVSDMTYSEWAGWKEKVQVQKPMAQKQEEFVPAKTKKEAEQYATRFADEVSYNGISVENCNEINKTLDELQRKYPSKKYSKIVGKKQKETASANYETLKINGSKIGSKEGAETFETMRKWDQYTLETLRAKYPGKMPPDVAKKVEKLEQNLRFDRWSISHTYGARATITHEYAHTLSDQYFGMINDTVANPNAKSAECLAIRRKIEATRKKAWETGDIFSVSKYAATDDDEFFAEVFSMREMGEKIPDYFDEMLDEALKNGIM